MNLYGPPAVLSEQDRPHELLTRVAAGLGPGKPADTLNLLTGPPSPWLQNARAVYQMRLGRPTEAVAVLRPLVFDPAGLSLKRDVPAVFLTNYATALLLEGNADGFFSVFHAIRDRDDPAVARISAALGRWRQWMTVWQRLGAFFGTGGPAFAIDFAPGDL